MNKDKSIIKKRKRVWDWFGWGYWNEPNRLFKTHSLNCGCSMCRAKTYFNRKDRRDVRHQSKHELRNLDLE